MKVVELLKISSPALKILSENEVNRDDWRYVPLYEEFQQMRRLGVKYDEAVRMLKEDYGIGRATVERAVARLGREIKDAGIVDIVDKQQHTKRCVKKSQRVRGRR